MSKTSPSVRDNYYNRTSDSYEVNTYNLQYLGYLETNGGCGVTGDLHGRDIVPFGGLCGGGALTHGMLHLLFKQAGLEQGAPLSL